MQTPESLTLTLQLPNRVLSPNCPAGSLRSRYMKAAATKKYRRLAKEALEEAQLESIPWKKTRIAPTFYWPDDRRRDQENAHIMLKPVYDGFVDANLVPDDDCKHMRKETPDFAVDKKHPRVELEITRLQ